MKSVVMACIISTLFPNHSVHLVKKFGNINMFDLFQEEELTSAIE